MSLLFIGETAGFKESLDSILHTEWPFVMCHAAALQCCSVQAHTQQKSCQETPADGGISIYLCASHILCAILCYRRRVVYILLLLCIWHQL